MNQNIFSVPLYFFPLKKLDERANVGKFSLEAVQKEMNPHFRVNTESVFSVPCRMRSDQHIAAGESSSKMFLWMRLRK